MQRGRHGGSGPRSELDEGKMTSEATELLERFRSAGVLDALDVHLARVLGRLGGCREPEVLLAAALASRAPRFGHICVEISMIRGSIRLEGLVDEAARLDWPAPDAWLAALQRSPLVRIPDPDRRASSPAAADELAAAADPPTPLVLERDRLYLDRYWRYEERLARELTARLALSPPELDEALLQDGLDRLFPRHGSSAAGGPDEGQRLAAERALQGCFTVISGGPGTGKTTTVKKILLLLLEQAWLRHERERVRGQGRGQGTGPFQPRLMLLAPTGKAAARLNEAIHEGLAGLPARPAELLAHLPGEAFTVHRALGVRPDRPTRFRHGPEEPLAADVVVVDEASMVDFALMTKLVEAVPRTARLILLGDRDQLASVEAGAVLGDLCPAGAAPGQGPLGARAVQLVHAWRFGADSGIGALARAVNAGRSDDVLAFLRQERTEPGFGQPCYPELELVDEAPGEGLEGRLRELVLAGYAPCLAAAVQAGDAAAALAALGRFRVLCAHRRGRLGVEGLNRRIESWLAEAGLISPAAAGGAYPGRPVMITENDYTLRLFNGDTGIVLADPAEPDARRACFSGALPGEVRRLAPARLPPHETVFAMTVHKSQGSQFEQVVVVLPERPSPVLTRELLYTAATRAREKVIIVGQEPVIRQAIGERVQRFSGLRDKLTGSAPATS